jgi:putative membrane-bound dehydrogenase-like protein
MSRSTFVLHFFLLSFSLFTIVSISAVIAQEPTIDELASKLLRIPVRSPAESLSEISMQDGFEVQLVASEPLVRDPVAIDFDEHGRMYVVELPEYNGYAVAGFKAKGSIRLLEDTDRDGTYDKATMFAEGLDYPTAVGCWDGGVFVGAAPDLLYLKDTDGDGKSDEQKVIFTGFGKDKAGEAHLNSFRWGFDNRIHFSTNLSGGDIRTPDQKEGRSVRGRGMIFDPRDPTDFELTSGGGQHGLSMDDWGRKFVCSNSVPAQTLMYDDRYLARNPLVQPPAAAVDIAPGGKHTRLFRISPEEPWRALRTKLRSTGRFRGSDEGGKPFGFFTGATGITIYRGDAWPVEYRGNLLVGDVANNLIYRATLDPKGVGLVANRADEGQEFLASRDIWFRPVQLANAPDGTLFVMDIYRELIEGAAFLPPEFVKYIDPVSGNDLGRIYRLAPKGFEPATVNTNLADLSTTQLVLLLEHPNGWHRDTASRLLYQKQDRSAVSALIELAQNSKSAVGRMTALHTLHGLNSLEATYLGPALSDADPRVIIQALRLSESFPRSPTLLALMEELVDHSNAEVRYQLAYTLGAMKPRDRVRLLTSLARSNFEDTWFRVALQTSLFDGADAVFDALVQDKGFLATKNGHAFLLLLAEQIGTKGRKDELAVMMQTLQRLPDTDQAFAQRLVEVLVARQKGEARAAILAAADGKAGEILAGMLRDAEDLASNFEGPLEARVQAIHSLRLASFGDVSELLTGLLDLNQPSSVQSAVLKTLGAYQDKRVATVVLRGWRGYSPSVRAEATETLLSRAVWVAAFLDAVESGTVKQSDLDPARIVLLKRHPDKDIAKRASHLFESNVLNERRKVVDAYQGALTLDANTTRGKQIFKKTCSACHRLEDVGTQVGADLTAIRNRGMAAVLLNVLDPNREVKPQFHTYVANTEDGRVIAGMIQTETANSLTIRRVDGTTVVLQRSEVEDLQSTGLSFMPEGLEKQITLQQMADLLSYLDSIR